ncbi:MAG: hypothetical protein IJZ73_06230 [Clostridia bacterium]|nr:hypothetical protein [Clostridia bacterium]
MVKEKERSRINKIFETSLSNLSTIIDVNTVIGSPIKLDNDEIIFPVAKVIFGVLSGGGEYGHVSVFKKSDDMPFTAGNGSIASIEPCGFLILDKSNGYKMVNVNNNCLDGAIEKIVEFIDKIKAEV